MIRFMSLLDFLFGRAATDQSQETHVAYAHRELAILALAEKYRRKGGLLLLARHYFEATEHIEALEQEVSRYRRGK
jgi:hypothetical protein